MTQAEQVKQALTIVQTLAAAIREAKKIPSGHLYAAVMSKVGLNDYNSAIGLLKKAGVVTEKGNELFWEAV